MEAWLKREGPAQAQSPILFSVPHAGRSYPAAMRDLSRLNNEQLQCLEDRFADKICATASASGHTAIINNIARAWIDLNRAEDEYDPAMVNLTSDTLPPARMTSKVRGGLGLIPRRIKNGGDIWRHLLFPEDVRQRIDFIHRPYHHHISEGLIDRWRHLGCAVLLDIHSMPPLPNHRSDPPAHIVVGNLFGRSASAALSDAVVSEARAAGFRVAINAPYAGGHSLERHGNPHRGVHAIQIEIDRRLYLDPCFDQLSGGAAAISHLIRRIADRVAEVALVQSQPIAAE